MRKLAAGLLLALAWTAMLGSPTASTFAVGLGLALLLVRFTDRLAGRETGDGRLRRTAAFLVFFLRELVVANLRVAADVVTRAHRSSPGLVVLPLRAASDLEITLLANLITLTPGTLSLDVSEDRRTLLVHAMFAADPDDVRRELAHLERRLLEVLR